MAGDPAERFERAMGRLFPANRGSGSPPGTLLSPAAAREGESAEEGGRGEEEAGGARPQCRPWDRGDVLRRLATFKSMTWFGKPQAAGPVACARRGWINVDADLLACEGCGAYLSFVLPSAAWARAESAAEAFAERLESGHKTLCAWKDNACSDALTLFPPSPPAALAQGFRDRCEKLLKLGALPAISSGAANAFKVSRGAEVEHLLQKAPDGAGFQDGIEGQGGGVGGEEAESGYGNEDFYRAQKLIALCGWEPRLLPYTVDSMEGSPPPSKVCQTGDASNAVVSMKARDPGPSVLMVSKGGGGDEKAKVGGKGETDRDPASAVLDCGLCRASVGLWGFSVIHRPTRTRAAAPQPPQGSADAAQMGGLSAASANGGGFAGGAPEKDGAEGAVAATPVRATRAPAPGVLNLSLTIAGGPPPTQLSSPALMAPAFGPMPGFLPRMGALEGGEGGDLVAASRESRGSDAGAQLGGGGTAKSLNGGVALPAGSAAEGTVGDVGECAEGKRAGSWKCRPSTDTSGVDQDSPGAARVAEEADAEVRGAHRKRRRTAESSAQGAGPGTHFPRQGARDLLPCSSSVNAVDTHYLQKQGNSVESVENRFQDSDGPETVVSDENDVEGCEDRADGAETVRQSGVKSGRSGQEPGLSKTDEVEFADRGVDTNVAVMSTGTGTGGAASVGMGMGIGDGGGSAGTQASHEIGMQEVNGADLSVHRPGTIPGDTEPVPEVTACQAPSGDAFGDSCEFMLAQRPQGRGYVNAGSGKKKAKRVYDEMDDQTVDTTKAMIASGDNGPDKDATDGHTVVGCEEEDHGCTTVNGQGRVSEEYRSWDTEAGKFDPIRQHRHFCPWVNGQVAAAAAGSSSSSGGQASACGWQLTLDAIYGQYEQGASNVPQAANKSESTASVYRANSAVSGRRLSGSSPLQFFGRRPLS